MSTGDSYHTMEELYDYRMAYNAAFFKLLAQSKVPARVHKSRKHHDGEPCFGGKYFVVMAELPSGQISNHYKLEHWDLFDVEEHELSDVWDGHTPDIALQRIKDYCNETTNFKNDFDQVISSFHYEYGENYSTLESKSELPKERIKPIIKQLKDKGFIKYYRGFMNWDDDEPLEVRGSGWIITSEGSQYIEDHNL